MKLRYIDGNSGNFIKRLELILDDILQSGRIQKDDLTILVVDEKI